MAGMIKVTFTVDEETIDTLTRVAARLKKPKSVIFREAIRDYSDRADRLSAEERDRRLAVMDRVMARKPVRSDDDVDAEIREIRSARRRGGRRTPVE
jgi:predicted transcriptional regulator